MLSDNHAHVAEQPAAAEPALPSDAQPLTLLYRTVFDAATDGMLVIGKLPEQAGDTIIDVNPAICAMTGYAADELLGTDPLRLVHSRDRPRASHANPASWHEEHVAAMLTAVRKDGSTFDAELRAGPLRYRGLRHGLLVLRDVTEREQAFRVLEQRVTERTHELTTLLEVARNVASTLELPSLLALVLDQLKEVVDHDGAAIMIREGDEFVIVETRDYRAAPDEPHVDQGMAGLRFPANRASGIWETLSRRESVIIGDVRGDEPLASEYRATVGATLTTTFSGVRSYLAIPLASRERVFGFVRLSWTRPYAFTPRHAELATAFATQAAIAFENARLFDMAQRQAAVEERQRLARELHDSVTQALFSMTLFARAAQIAFDQTDVDAEGTLGRRLAQLRSLTQGALAEMRALIFELRPGALEEEGLVAALQRQAAALTAREGLPIAVTGPDLRLPLSPDTEEHLYRLALEALHNTLKHAAATCAWVTIDLDAAHVTLEIGDDGRGFDPTVARPGHLGLSTMADRAARIGGRLNIESAPGAGTRTRVTLPLDHSN
jgi:PAS domain S-box-containing protein